MGTSALGNLSPAGLHEEESIVGPVGVADVAVRVFGKTFGPASWKRSQVFDLVVPVDSILIVVRANRELGRITAPDVDADFASSINGFTLNLVVDSYLGLWDVNGWMEYSSSFSTLAFFICATIARVLGASMP